MLLLKDKIGLRMKNLIFWVLTEKSNFQGGEFTKNQYRGGDCLKGGESLDSLQISGGTWQEKGDWGGGRS